MSNVRTVKIETGKPLIIKNREGQIVIRLLIEAAEHGPEIIVDMDSNSDFSFLYSSSARRRIDALTQECLDQLPR